MASTPRSLAEALSLLKDRYGPGALRRGSDPLAAAVWPSGLPMLVSQLLAGGLPVGRVTVIAGQRPAGAAGEGATGRLSLIQILLALASRQMQVAYIDLPGTLDPGYLFDSGLDPASCLVVRPPGGAVGPGMAMARTLILAGLPWVAIAFPDVPQSAPSAWLHPLSALAAAVTTARAVACVSAPAPLPKPLAHASSLTITCASQGWHLEHGDVDGIRVGLTVTKSKVGAPGAAAAALVRYPRPHQVADVTGLPTLLRRPPDVEYAIFADELGQAGRLPTLSHDVIIAG